MAWYDTFSNFYDASIERYYAEHRPLAAAALKLRPGACVLDLPCGTGQSFSALTSGVGPEGLVIGADLSLGMLRKAKLRAERESLATVRVLHGDASALERPAIDAAAGRPVKLTHLHVFLGMSVFPDMAGTFSHLWGLLESGGRCVLVDVHADKLGLQGWLVNKTASADIRRRFWEPLEAVAHGFERHDLPFRREHGGQIMLAVGVKP
ncbi:MAG: methyltransferase domain-containing protein [Polyangiales bacterium]